MNCISCSQPVQKIHALRPVQYKGETVQIEDEFFHCPACGEEFVSPEQFKERAKRVRNEVRKKYGLLSPERITAIRKKRKLTQRDLEHLLGIGDKVVVRWENGKVIQSAAHDLVLRLLEKDAHAVDLLAELEKARASEQKKYSRSHGHSREAAMVR
jgi:putative zinc finger/helix-turn-helix YgiT family protein